MTISCGIIDISISNKKNIFQACEKVGLKPSFIDEPDKIEKFDTIIFPGNGSFNGVMKILNKKNYVDKIAKHISSGKIFLGICLGMQILFKKSNERGFITPGLGILDGEVKEIKKNSHFNINIPIVGWLPFNKKKKIFKDKKFLTKFKDDTVMYFNNSCEVKTTNENYNIYYAEYGNLTFCSAVTYENIILTQFHPELSSNDGLKVFKYLKDKI